MNLLLSVGSVFATIGYVILAIVILLLMVLIHEFGHYIVGRKLGFKITEFSVGFGKAIFQKTNKRGEKISLRIFPLGGYCAFAGEGEDDEEDKKTEDPEVQELKEQKPRDYLYFNEQKPWKRLLVYMAGVTFNFISAILFSFILLLSYGYDIPRVAKLNTEYSYLYSAGENALEEGDVIWTVDGTRISFAFTDTFGNLLQRAGENTDITLGVKRDGKDVEVVVKYEILTTLKDGKEVKTMELGFKTEPYTHSFLEALGRCFELAFGFAWVILKGLGQIITGQIAFSELGGSISTIGMISNILQTSFANVLILLSLLAANLAVFNFLPIPALDGGHAVFTLLEWIFKKPVVSRKVENNIHFYGLLALLLLVVVADVVHIIVVGL